MTIEAWQRQLRKQFGSEQPFRIEYVGIRGVGPGRNFCSCADFKTNTLGTCKHIEADFATIRTAASSSPPMRAASGSTSSMRAW